MKKYQMIVLLVIVALLSSGITYSLTSGKSVAATDDTVTVSKTQFDTLVKNQQRFSKLLTLEQTIKEKFYTDTKEVDFDSAIIKGLFAALKDPYSEYYTADEYNSLKEDLAGSFVGIGAYVEKAENGLVTVVSPIKGSPAEAAGLQPGDQIYQVDEQDVSILTIQEAVKFIKGEPGTKVKVYILRGNQQLDFTITRAQITVPSVEFSMKPGNVGYIQITGFEDPTYEMFMKAYATLESQGAVSYVIDLRNNPGGSLQTVEQIADQILPAMKIVTTKNRAGQEQSAMSDDANQWTKPFVVLVNKGSASASEILAGAVQDSGKGKIIGETTFGKGIVQTVQSLNDGTGFKLTVEYWLTPKGNMIHKKGVVPDINLEDMKAKGYTNPEKLTFGAADDGVLNYALDLLSGKIK